MVQKHFAAAFAKTLQSRSADMQCRQSLNDQDSTTKETHTPDPQGAVIKELSRAFGQADISHEDARSNTSENESEEDTWTWEQCEQCFDSEKDSFPFQCFENGVWVRDPRCGDPSLTGVSVSVLPYIA